MMGLQSTFNSSGIVVSLIVSGLLAGIHWRAAFCVFLLALPLLPLIRSIRPPTHVACPPGTSAPGSAQSFPLWLLYFFGLSAMMAFNIIPTQLPFYLHSLEGASSAKIGIIIALLPIASAIAGRTYARFSQKINPWTYFIFPGAVMCAGFWLLSLSTHTPGFVLSMLLIGTGFGLTMPHVNIVLFSIVPPAAAGKSMGILAGAKFFGLFLSPFLAHPIIARFGYQEMLRASGGYIFFAAVTLSLVGLVAYIKKESTDDS
jgi:MFS family permease